MPKVYVLLKITNINGEMNVLVQGVSYDELEVNRIANEQRRFINPAYEIIDIFETTVLV
jgi:hypothetical protein